MKNLILNILAVLIIVLIGIGIGYLINKNNMSDLNIVSDKINAEYIQWEDEFKLSDNLIIREEKSVLYANDKEIFNDFSYIINFYKLNNSEFIVRFSILNNDSWYLFYDSGNKYIYLNEFATYDLSDISLNKNEITIISTKWTDYSPWYELCDKYSDNDAIKLSETYTYYGNGKFSNNPVISETKVSDIIEYYTGINTCDVVGENLITLRFEEDGNIIEYSYEKEPYNYISINLNNFKINNIDVTDKISSLDLGNLEFKFNNDFVIIDSDTDGTCGTGISNLIIFDYNGNIIFQDKIIENDIDVLMYSNYEYDEKTMKLKLYYHLSCDMDCNTCDEFFDDETGNYALCKDIEKYKNSISSATYVSTYLGNGKFSDLELLENKKIIDDEYYNYIFEKCR